MSWQLRKLDRDVVARLASELRIHAVTAQCLVGRGVTDVEHARRYLDPRLAALRPPSGLAGLEKGVERIAHAVENREHIGCFGDYDVDGVTTAALMTSALRDFGGVCVPRVARRDAGYGFGSGDVEFFANQGCTLIITGDCGTSDRDAINDAKQRGIDVVVVDHHTVPSSADGEHPALALINPFREDSTFPFTGMASVGLAFYLMVSLRTHLRKTGYFQRGSAVEPELKELLDLVALGTVADLVPLKGENRILTTMGLRELNKRSRPGLAALMHVAGVDFSRPIDEQTIGWKLGPRLNAPGRLGNAQPALDLLLARDEATAKSYAEQLEQINQERREAQAKVLQEVDDMLDGVQVGPAVVIAGAGWPPGVVGIVASRLVERYQRPAFVIAVDPETGEGRGSARSSQGVNLYEALSECSDVLVRFGGHAAAAGLTIREQDIDSLREGLSQAVARQLAATLDYESDVVADAHVELGQINERLVNELNSLAPFGKGNERPLLVCAGMRVCESRRVGDGSHLKLDLESNGARLGAIAFKMGELDPGPEAVVDAAFVPVVSTWRGRSRVELEIQGFDVQTATNTSADASKVVDSSFQNRTSPSVTSGAPESQASEIAAT